ncbi:MAG: hypothetical protein CO098_06605, partial [Bacteroidetes bacterium CG_4_9_14_3_um_filter_41_19]
MKQSILTKAKYAFILLSLLSWTILSAQNEANIWYFGDYAGLDFNSGTPVALTDGALSTQEGCATISDANGSLLFYTEGTTVWNKNHAIMDNGTGLMGGWSSTQSAIIVPKPNSTTLYYVFTVESQAWTSGLLDYSIVDMSLNGGLGKVITKNVVLHSPVAEKINAVQHSNGTDIWVVTHERNNDAFCSFLVTASGVNSTPVISNTGAIHGNQSSSYRGHLKISSSGNYLAVAIDLPVNLAEIFDFDNNTGIVSNPISITGYSSPYGIEFSPDESRIYFGMEDDVFQFNLLAGSSNDIINSATNINATSPSAGGAIQLSPDGKIYRTYLNCEYLGVIDDPNALGTACNYIVNGVYLGGKLGKLGLPDFIQSYFSANISYQNTCFGQTTTFSIQTSDPIQSILWNFGDPASGSNNTSTL